jgi:hypothetical protein
MSALYVKRRESQIDVKMKMTYNQYLVHSSCCQRAFLHMSGLNIQNLGRGVNLSVLSKGVVGLYPPLMEVLGKVHFYVWGLIGGKRWKC